MKEISAKIRKIEEVIGLMQKNLECAICLDMLNNPVSTKCDHQFCRFCITEFLQSKASVPCPLCKKPVTKRSLSERPKLGDIVCGVRKLMTAFQADQESSRSPSRSLQSCLPLLSAVSTQAGLSTRSKRTVEQSSSANEQNEEVPKNVRFSKRRKTEVTHVFIDDLTEEPKESTDLVQTHVNVSGGFPATRARRGKGKGRIRQGNNFKRALRNGVRQAEQVDEDEGLCEIELVRYLEESSCGGQSPSSKVLGERSVSNIDEITEDEVDGDVRIKVEGTDTDTCGQALAHPESDCDTVPAVEDDDLNVDVESEARSPSERLEASEESESDERNGQKDINLSKDVQASSKGKAAAGPKHKTDESDPGEGMDYGFMEEKFGQTSHSGRLPSSLSQKINNNTKPCVSKHPVEHSTSGPPMSPKSSSLDKFKGCRTYSIRQRCKKVSNWIYSLPPNPNSPTVELTPAHGSSSSKTNARVTSDETSDKDRSATASETVSKPPQLARKIFKSRQLCSVKEAAPAPPARPDTTETSTDEDPYKFIPSQRTPKRGKNRKRQRGGRGGPRKKSKPSQQRKPALLVTQAKPIPTSKVLVESNVPFTPAQAAMETQPFEPDLAIDGIEISGSCLEGSLTQQVQNDSTIQHHQPVGADRGSANSKVNLTEGSAASDSEGTVIPPTAHVFVLPHKRVLHGNSEKLQSVIPDTALKENTKKGKQRYGKGKRRSPPTEEDVQRDMDKLINKISQAESFELMFSSQDVQKQMIDTEESVTHVLEDSVKDKEDLPEGSGGRSVTVERVTTAEESANLADNPPTAKVLHSQKSTTSSPARNCSKIIDPTIRPSSSPMPSADVIAPTLSKIGKLLKTMQLKKKALSPSSSPSTSKSPVVVPDGGQSSGDNSVSVIPPTGQPFGLSNAPLSTNPCQNASKAQSSQHLPDCGYEFTVKERDETQRHISSTYTVKDREDLAAGSAHSPGLLLYTDMTEGSDSSSTEDLDIHPTSEEYANPGPDDVFKSSSISCVKETLPQKSETADKFSAGKKTDTGNIQSLLTPTAQNDKQVIPETVASDDLIHPQAEEKLSSPERQVNKRLEPALRETVQSKQIISEENCIPESPLVTDAVSDGRRTVTEEISTAEAPNVGFDDCGEENLDHTLNNSEKRNTESINTVGINMHSDKEVSLAQNAEIKTVDGMEDQKEKGERQAGKRLCEKTKQSVLLLEESERETGKQVCKETQQSSSLLEESQREAGKQVCEETQESAVLREELKRDVGQQKCEETQQSGVLLEESQSEAEKQVCEETQESAVFREEMKRDVGQQRCGETPQSGVLLEESQSEAGKQECDQTQQSAVLLEESQVSQDTKLVSGPAENVDGKDTDTVGMPESIRKNLTSSHNKTECLSDNVISSAIDISSTRLQNKAEEGGTFLPTLGDAENVHAEVERECSPNQKTPINPPEAFQSDDGSLLGSAYNDFVEEPMSCPLVKEGSATSRVSVDSSNPVLIRTSAGSDSTLKGKKHSDIVPVIPGASVRSSNHELTKSSLGKESSLKANKDSDDVPSIPAAPVKSSNPTLIRTSVGKKFSPEANKDSDLVPATPGASVDSSNGVLIKTSVVKNSSPKASNSSAEIPVIPGAEDSPLSSIRTRSLRRRKSPRLATGNVTCKTTQYPSSREGTWTLVCQNEDQRTSLQKQASEDLENLELKSVNVIAVGHQQVTSENKEEKDIEDVSKNNTVDGSTEETLPPSLDLCDKTDPLEKALPEQSQRSVVTISDSASLISCSPEHCDQGSIKLPSKIGSRKRARKSNRSRRQEQCSDSETEHQPEEILIRRSKRSRSQRNYSQISDSLKSHSSISQSILVEPNVLEKPKNIVPCADDYVDISTPQTDKNLPLLSQISEDSPVKKSAEDKASPSNEKLALLKESVTLISKLALSQALKSKMSGVKLDGKSNSHCSAPSKLLIKSGQEHLSNRSTRLNPVVSKSDTHVSDIGKPSTCSGPNQAAIGDLGEEIPFLTAESTLRLSAPTGATAGVVKPCSVGLNETPDSQTSRVSQVQAGSEVSNSYRSRLRGSKIRGRKSSITETESTIPEVVPDSGDSPKANRGKRRQSRARKPVIVESSDSDSDSPFELDEVEEFESADDGEPGVSKTTGLELSAATEAGKLDVTVIAEEEDDSPKKVSPKGKSKKYNVSQSPRRSRRINKQVRPVIIEDSDDEKDNGEREEDKDVRKEDKNVAEQDNNEGDEDKNEAEQDSDEGEDDKNVKEEDKNVREEDKIDREEDNYMCEREEDNNGDDELPDPEKSDDEQLSQGSKSANLTSSSAFSSQSEVLCTQQRSKLEQDVERMKREIEALEAQLAARDSILLETTLRESREVETVHPEKTAQVSSIPNTRQQGNSKEEDSGYKPAELTLSKEPQKDTCTSKSPEESDSSDEDMTGVVPPSNLSKGDNQCLASSQESDDLFMSLRSPSPPPPQPDIDINPSAVTQVVTKLKEFFKAVSPQRPRNSQSEKYSLLSQDSVEPTPPGSPHPNKTCEDICNPQGGHPKSISLRQSANSPSKKYSSLGQDSVKSTPPGSPHQSKSGRESINPRSGHHSQVGRDKSSVSNILSPASFQAGRGKRNSLQSPAFTRAFSAQPLRQQTPTRSGLISPMGRKTPNSGQKSSSRRLCFVTTGLHLSQMQKTQKLAQMFEAKVQPKFSPAATHVIVKPVSDGSLVCDRTFKYFQAIAHHCWLVSYQWVEDCITAQEILPETSYEIQGDTVSGKHRGPRRSRLYTTPVFTEFEFYCHGDSPNIPPGEFQNMLTVSGGTVVTSPEALGVDPDKTQLILDMNDDQNTADIRLFNRLYKRYRVVTVSREWAFDTITQYKVQPLPSFVLTSLPNLDLPFV